VLQDSSGIVMVSAQDGVVVITGPLDDRGLVAVAIRLAWGVDGVVDVIDQRGAGRDGTEPAGARPAPAPASHRKEM
jgi:BON domain